MKPLLAVSFVSILVLGCAPRALAQLGQSDWICPDDTQSQPKSFWHKQRTDNSANAQEGVLGQSGWLRPSTSSLNQGGAVMLNANGAGAELQGNVSQSEYAPPAVGTGGAGQTMQAPVATMQMGGEVPACTMQVGATMQPGVMFQGGLPINSVPPDAQMGTAPQQANAMPAMNNAPMMNSSPQMNSAPATMQATQMQRMPSAAAQTQTISTPCQQAGGMAVNQMPANAMQQTTVFNPSSSPANYTATGNASASAPPAVPASTSDDSLSRVVFGVPGNGAGSSADNALAKNMTNALTTMAEINEVGSMLGGMLQGMGWDNHFHTYGPGGVSYGGLGGIYAPTIFPSMRPNYVNPYALNANNPAYLSALRSSRLR